MSKIHVTTRVNGDTVEFLCDPRETLLDVLRDRLGLTGTHVGCEHGVCGACTVRLNGVTARACLTFAAQVDGARIETVEHLGTVASLNRIQQAFRKHHALQCGFCTPGFLMTVQEMLETLPLETDEEIRDALSGNICRCTGYEHIVRAVRELADEREGAAA